VQALSLRCQHFSQLIKTYLKGKDLQLLCDVDVRWRSTYLMIKCALELKNPLDAITQTEEFDELRKYRLSDSEWDALVTARNILEVPFDFQQKFSAEKTPTLCDTIPHFEAMIQVWKEMQDKLGASEKYVILSGHRTVDSFTT
ncbi:hypothetical protein BDZ97DRAFT_1677140, partial [Flammula alnicola]